MFSRLKAAAFAIMAGMAVTSAASAQTFTFAGTTGGCFYTGATACTPASGTQTLGGVSYTGSSFGGTTSNGFLGVGGVGNNLGTLVLTGQTFTYAGNSFVLGVTFTLPSGTTPNNSTFNATLLGSVSNTTDGGVKFDFDNTPKSFAFNGGTFTLQVDDVSVFPNLGQAVVSGTIIAAPGPIVGAGIPVLLGLAGVVLFRRRKQTV